MMRTRRLSWLVLIGSICVTLLCEVAVAQGPPVARSPWRIIGFGTTLGAGYWVAKAGDIKVSGVPIFVADLWVDVSVTRRVTLQAWFPVLHMALFNRLFSGKTFWMQLFAKIYPLRDNAGLYVAPGAGFIYLKQGSASAVVPEIALQLGWEFSNVSRWFGFTLGVRPWLDIIKTTAGTSATAVGFGITGELGFHFYVVTR
ncbi:MAG: hypothetical protein KC609_19330 [Myxococcales bacterium]|nr:hypothetical protein [Myxococcales bacterium]